MSPARLDCQTKGTKIITSCLDDHIFSGEEFFSGDFFERPDFRRHHGFFLFWGHMEVVWIFGEDFYLVSIGLELMIYLEKSGIHDAVPDIPTSRQKEFFMVSDFWEDFFCVLYPLCFSLIGDDTWRDKISTLIRQVWMDEPFFCEIFIGLTAKYFVVQNRKINRGYLYRKISLRQILYIVSISIRRFPISTSRILTRSGCPMIYAIFPFLSMSAPRTLSRVRCTFFAAHLPI